jgi:hypothetical protein
MKYSALKEVQMTAFWEGFAKYVGVSGVIALMLVGAYVASVFVPAQLPPGFEQVMLLVVGYYFGKNGHNIVNAFAKAVRR